MVEQFYFQMWFNIHVLLWINTLWPERNKVPNLHNQDFDYLLRVTVSPQNYLVNCNFIVNFLTLRRLNQKLLHILQTGIGKHLEGFLQIYFLTRLSRLIKIQGDRRIFILFQWKVENDVKSLWTNLVSEMSQNKIINLNLCLSFFLTLSPYIIKMFFLFLRGNIYFYVKTLIQRKLYFCFCWVKSILRHRVNSRSRNIWVQSEVLISGRPKSFSSHYDKNCIVGKILLFVKYWPKRKKTKPVLLTFSHFQTMKSDGSLNSFLVFTVSPTQQDCPNELIFTHLSKAGEAGWTAWALV